MSAIIIPILMFILGTFVTAIMDRFIWPGLLGKIEISILGPKRVILNIAELTPFEAGSQMHLENFNLTFATAMGRGWVVAIKKGHDDLRKEFGQVLFPTALSGQFDMIDYSVMVKNTGVRRLSNIRVKIRSKDEIKYKKEELRNVDFVNCGGFSENRFCEIRVDKLKKDSMAGLLVGTSKRGIWDVECGIDNSVQICEKNYQNFYVADIAKITAAGLDFGDRKVIINSFPSISNQSALTIYSYSPTENKWSVIKNEN